MNWLMCVMGYEGMLKGQGEEMIHNLGFEKEKEWPLGLTSIQFTSLQSTLSFLIPVDPENMVDP